MMLYNYQINEIEGAAALDAFQGDWEHHSTELQIYNSFSSPSTRRTDFTYDSFGNWIFKYLLKGREMQSTKRNNEKTLR